MRKNQFTAFLVQEAKKIGISATPIDPGWEMVELSDGESVQRVYGGVLNDMSSSVGHRIAMSKYFSYYFLKKHKYPTLPQIKTSRITEARAFLKKHKKIVLKPPNLKQGKGIIVNIQNNKELSDGWRYSFEFAKELIVQKYFNGMDVRVLVINYSQVFAVHRMHAHVIGDGEQNIKTLIENKNKKRKKSKGQHHIVLDDISRNLLRKQGKTIRSIPKKGEIVVLKGTANLHTGADTRVITQDIPNAIKKEAIALAKELKQSALGVDYLFGDNFNHRYIIELNPNAGFRLHHYPTIGEGEKPAQAFLEMLFPKKFR